MGTWYLDTSAAAKLIVKERESSALILAIQTDQPRLVSSVLPETELRRAALRNPAVKQGDVTTFLTSLDIYEIDATVYRQAGLLPGAHLRSRDAIHLACALLLDASAVITYDKRMLEAATEVGIEALSPGI